jgi:hypothetical protein
LNFRKKSSFSQKKQASLEQLIKLKLENYLEIEDLLQIAYSFKNSIASLELLNLGTLFGNFSIASFHFSSSSSGKILRNIDISIDYSL